MRAATKETTLHSHLRVMTTPRHAPWRLLGLALASTLIASCGGGGGGGGGSPIEIRTLSNRADLVSDGNVLVEVTAPPGQVKAGMQIQLNGADVTSSFVDQGNGRLVGLVSGLVVGNNVLRAAGTIGLVPAAQLVITNSPRSGPVYSGAQVKPFYCATPTAQPPSGNQPATLASGLSGQPDENCNIATETRLYYRTTAAAGTCSTAMPETNPANPCWKAYTPGTTPADLATTTTDQGQTVPFIVRLERGTMNRGIYDLAVLFDPTKDWKPTAPQAQWNGKVYYSFGASTGQPRRQSRPASSWATQEEQLKRGYLVVANSMTDSARNSNRVLMTETVMMMKEHIVDSYGPIRFTMGTGCSGGSINSNMNLSIYPGLLDGVVTSCTYPDSETTSHEVGDCVLLVEAYQKPEMTSLWTGLTLSQADINARKAAINGHLDQTACHSWFNAFGSNGKAGLYFQRLVSDNVTGAIFQETTARNNCELPNTAVYDPARPAETASLPRCNAWSWAESIWGKVPGSPAARDTRDNVGVQYGLGALLAGKITPEEFVTLNEVVGGIDRDSTARAQRSVADTEALSIAYRSGIVASGANLAKGAIIDLRGWDDSVLDVPPGRTANAASFSAIHHVWFSFAVRDRIVRDYGDAGNQALWRFARTGLGAPGTVGLEAFNTMDKWLADLVTEPSNRRIEEKVRATRPADSRDFCIPPADATQTTRIYDMAQCDQDKYLKPSLSPRQVAGGPRAEDVLKCQLKPLNAADYGSVGFTGPQWSRLQAVFAGGVCDWSKPGVGQQAAASPLTFRNGPGGQPLGDAPVSTRD